MYYTICSNTCIINGCYKIPKQYFTIVFFVKKNDFTKETVLGLFISIPAPFLTYLMNFVFLNKVHIKFEIKDKNGIRNSYVFKPKLNEYAPKVITLEYRVIINGKFLISHFGIIIQCSFNPIGDIDIKLANDPEWLGESDSDCNESLRDNVILINVFNKFINSDNKKHDFESSFEVYILPKRVKKCNTNFEYSVLSKKNTNFLVMYLYKYFIKVEFPLFKVECKDD